MKLNRIVKEGKDLTLKDIEHGYGKEVAQALVKYCALKKLDMDEVVSDLRTDGNGMTPWDKFDVWAQNTLDLDIMKDFDDTYDWSGAEERERKERERAEQEKEDELAFKKGLKEIEKNKKDLKKLRRDLRRKNRKSGRMGRVYQAPTDFSTMDESSGSRMEESDILDWIFQEMGECEWAEDMEYLDDGNAFEFSMPGPDGDVFKVSVTKVWSGRLGNRLD